MKQVWFAFCAVLASCSSHGTSTLPAAGQALSSDRSETRSKAKIALRSPAFANGAAIPIRYSAYGDGVSPALRWSAVPARAKSLVLMMEDPDATSAKPYVHWLVWNIDPKSGGLPEGVTPDQASIRQGRTTRGSVGYMGPRPRGSDSHHYHFQLFALDTILALEAGADRASLLHAIDGHVLAKGALVGLYPAPKADPHP